MDLQWKDSGSSSTVFSTELNGLTNTNKVISSADTNTNSDLYCDLELLVKYVSIPAAGTKVAYVYFLPSVDGTNYPNGGSGTTVAAIPSANLLFALFESRAGSTTVLERIVVTGILCPPRSFKVLLRNTSGRAYGATGNVLTMRKYKLQSV